MDSKERSQHWENIYTTKSLTEVSWYQPTPQTSIDLIKQCSKSKHDKIIDIGGGDSFLVDHLIELGYTDISVLDISEMAIQRAKNRLGEKAKLVKWIVSDIVNFKPQFSYDIWHDRAAFHFLTNENDIDVYKSLIGFSILKKGFLILGTFSNNGPLKCSGISIKQYNEQSLIELAQPNFKLEGSFTLDHETPFNTHQNFIFGIFSKL